MQYMNQDDNYNVDVLNENFKELSQAPVVNSKEVKSKVVSGKSNELAKFVLPNTGKYYIVVGNVFSQNNTGAVIGLQLHGGLFTLDNFTSTNTDQNIMNLTIAQASSEILFTGWGTVSGDVDMKYIYVQIG